MSEQWTVKDASKSWGVSENLVLRFLQQGRVPNAERKITAHGIMAWYMPADTPKPKLMKSGPKPKNPAK